jgi:hypothetical protein
VGLFATQATRDLNETVYECIGLSEPKPGRLVALLAELRASGNEFDVEHSDEVVEEVGTRQAKKRAATAGSRWPDRCLRPGSRAESGETAARYGEPYGSDLAPASFRLTP